MEAHYLNPISSVFPDVIHHALARGARKIARRVSEKRGRKSKRVVPKSGQTGSGKRKDSGGSKSRRKRDVDGQLYLFE
jgi:hypothetical protein